MLGDDQSDDETMQGRIKLQHLQQRPQKARQMPARYVDYKLFSSHTALEDGDSAHFTLLVNAEPISLEDVMKEEV